MRRIRMRDLSKSNGGAESVLLILTEHHERFPRQLLGVIPSQSPMKPPLSFDECAAKKDDPKRIHCTEKGWCRRFSGMSWYYCARTEDCEHKRGDKRPSKSLVYRQPKQEDVRLAKDDATNESRQFVWRTLYELTGADGKLGIAARAVTCSLAPRTARTYGLDMPDLRGFKSDNPLLEARSMVCEAIAKRADEWRAKR